MQRMALSAIEKALPTIVKALFALFAAAILLMLTSEQALAKDSEILKRDGFWIQVYYDSGDVPTKACAVMSGPKLSWCCRRQSFITRRRFP